MKLRRMLCSFLIVAILSVQLDIPVKASRDYLNITLADIIVAWYNASGVAIGDSELFNAIQDTYGSITINDLIENECFIIGGAPDNDFATDKDAIRDMIGYGSLTAPAIEVRPDKLMLYLQGYPIRESARDSLMAMFGNVTGDDLPTEVFTATLGFVIGMVANLGKIGNDIDQAVIQNIGNYWQKFNEWWPVKTLKGVYRKFTDSTYFQDLLEEGIPGPGSGGGSGDSESYGVTVDCPLNGYDGIGNTLILYRSNDQNMNGSVFRLMRDCVPCVWHPGPIGTEAGCVVNLTNETKTFQVASVSHVKANDTISPTDFTTYSVGANSMRFLGQGSGIDPVSFGWSGYALGINDQTDVTRNQVIEYCREHNPWGASEEPSNGTTNYINNAVGNIASDNYINLSPNIGNNEYMYIFDRLTYIEELNQITQNTDNGDYSQNSTVINNYNNQYIQGGVPDVRPTSAPASNPEVQPEMPFVSPRPTQPPEFVEQVVQEGGLSEEITMKFPFCIPWDIKALIDNLWAPEARAPYIHWEATFGEWGKLGEVTLDFSEFDSAARIFRSTTLLLWIVGLVLITRNLIG